MSDIIPIAKCPNCGKYDKVELELTIDGRSDTSRFKCNNCNIIFNRKQTYSAYTASTLNATVTGTSAYCPPIFFASD